MQTYIFCVLLKLGKSMVIQSKKENPRRLGTINSGSSNEAETHLTEKRIRRRRRRLVDKSMHAQCIRCRPVQNQTEEQIRIVRSMVSHGSEAKRPTKQTLSERQ